ncbi:MAG: PAS domain S-box protein, partial [Verrucomicrobiaceae bacterium]
MSRGDFQTRLCQRLRRIAALAAGFVSVLGVLVLAGWMTQTEVLMRILPEAVAMNTLTASCFILAGFSLWLQVRERAEAVAKGLALLIANVGGVRFICHIAEWPFPLDQWFFGHVVGHNGPMMGSEMAPTSAACFLIAGLALALLDRRTPRGTRVSEILASVIWLLSLLALVGYIYQTHWLYGVPFRLPMALNTSIAFLTLSMGVLFARPDQGIMSMLTSASSGGVMARRMLPAMVLVFITAGGLRIAGQVHGLYSAELGVVFHAVASVGILGIFIVWCAHILHRLDLERQKTEEDRERFFSLSLDLLCVAGTDGYFRKVNPAFTRTLGYTEVEMLSRPFVDFIHPADLASTEAEVASLSTGLPSVHFENRYRCKDGSWKWLAWNTHPFTEEGLLYAVARDVTERKEVEIAMLSLNSALIQQADRLEAVNQELESFSYSVSHDLRAPLRGISGFAQALEEHAAPTLDDTGRAFLQRVQRAAERMGWLIDDLLKLSRLSRAEMTSETVDLSELANAVVSGLRSAEPGRNVAVDICPDILVKGDPALLRVVLDNLIGNAWKFTSKTPDARIGLTCCQGENGRVTCTVSDNGAGFDMRYAHKLFGAFQRLHSQVEFPGSGIGLATVQRIIRRHGGEVRATGEINHGARFE